MSILVYATPNVEDNAENIVGIARHFKCGWIFLRWDGNPIMPNGIAFTTATDPPFNIGHSDQFIRYDRALKLYSNNNNNDRRL